MDSPTELVAILSSLDPSVAAGEHQSHHRTRAVERRLAALAATLGTAVASYRGLQLTLHEDGYPVVLTAFAADPGAASGQERIDGTTGRDPILTSLRLPLRLVHAGFEDGSQIVFYASRPGAFVDLAADLSYTLSPPTPERSSGPDEGPVIVLDADLPPNSRTSGFSGLSELSTINHAVGFMLARGHRPDEVHQTLRRHAAAVGLSPRDFAARMILPLSHP